MAKCMWILAALAGTAAAQEQAAPAQQQEKAPGFLGVRVGALDAVTEGAVILEAMADLPAAKAGLRRGDVVVRFAGSPVRTPDDLIALVRAKPPGDEVAYVVRRGDGTIDGRLKLGRQAPEAPPMETPLEERLDRVQRDIEGVERRLRKGPRTIGEWLRVEERRLEDARARGDREAARRAEIRAELLRELAAEGVRGPGQPAAAGRWEIAPADLERIERKLDRILERLGER
jgi:hypothetical protein